VGLIIFDLFMNKNSLYEKLFVNYRGRLPISAEIIGNYRGRLPISAEIIGDVYPFLRIFLGAIRVIRG
jgi:hypothetical protein